jgi:hypothetical protein
MRSKKPTRWDGESTLCTSPYPVQQGGCLGQADFGTGIQYQIPGEDLQRYCIPCHERKCREEYTEQDLALG